MCEPERSTSRIVCAISATIHRSTVTVDANWMNGMLCIEQYSPTLNMLYFCPFSSDSKAICVDLDVVTSVSDFIVANISKSCSISFAIPNKLEKVLFDRAILECRNICDITLRIAALTRDIYFAGIYSNVSTDHELKIMDELKKSQATIDITFESMASHDFNPALSAVDNSTEDIPFISCFYCEKNMHDTTEVTEYVIHPYVPRKFNKDHIYMCVVCVNNWKEYRDIAEESNQLILDGEINEEVCCLCSDQPAELNMCDSCPRSFCIGCLKKVLTEQEYNRVQSDKDTDWVCMCCKFNISRDPLPRKSWRMINVLQFPSKPVKSTPSKRSIIADAIDVQKKAIPAKSKSIEYFDDMKFPTPQSFTKVKTEKKLNPTEPVEQSKPVFERESSMSPPPTIAKKRKNKEYNEDKLPSNFEAEEGLNDGDSQVEGSGENEVIDDMFYFQQYLSYYNRLCYDCETPKSTESDDACFLCKDGGELIECDWRLSGHQKRGRCRKVYHADCLSYAIDDSISTWYCPRHFCDICGTEELKYVCLYCPVSICEKCPEEMVKQFGHKRYVEIECPQKNEELSKVDVTTIVCQTCLDLLTKVRNANRYKRNQSQSKIASTILKNKVLYFPGEVSKLCVSGLFKKVTSNGVPQQPLAPVAVVASTASSSCRPHRWKTLELEELQACYEIHGIDLNKILSDKSLPKSFARRAPSSIQSKLIQLYGPESTQPPVDIPPPPRKKKREFREEMENKVDEANHDSDMDVDAQFEDDVSASKQSLADVSPSKQSLADVAVDNTCESSLVTEGDKSVQYDKPTLSSPQKSAMDEVNLNVLSDVAEFIMSTLISDNGDVMI